VQDSPCLQPFLITTLDLFWRISLIILSSHAGIATTNTVATMDKISRFNLAHKYYKRSLLIAINLVAGLSIFFFGYDQGVMGGVNTNRDYATLMGFGEWEEHKQEVKVTHSLLQGGIIAVYYLPGTLVGAFLGGWFGDKYGRIMCMGVASIWTMFGAALQASAQNNEWMFVARVFNGIGTGMLNAITPVWATETASHTSRGAFVAIEFTLNIFGVVVAYWLEYGLTFYGDGTSSFIWRFPIAFQIVPLIFLVAIIWFMPESPRWLVKVGRVDEARYILGRLRGEGGDDIGKAEAEFQDICNVVALERETSDQQTYYAMFFGIKSGKLHTGRRVQLVIWLQILQEWIGIAGITIYGPEIFKIAGIGSSDRLWVSGLNNITYMLSTLICVFTIDRIGRRWTLYWGAVGQGICCFLAGGLSRGALDHPDNPGYGYGATFSVYLYTFIFGATWLTVPWLYPAEIFPLQVRAKGNAWGVIGWSIGNGWCVLLLPTIFANIGEKTLYLFGIVNAVCIVIVWALYPETARRTLEEINLVFASDSIWNWEAEKNFAILKAENPELVQAAQRGVSVIDPETGLPRHSSVGGPRRFSLAPKGASAHIDDDKKSDS
jgi:sugar porter (SP) family MFS transporter